MASNNIARLGVVLGLDTSEFTAEVDKAILVNKKLADAIKKADNAAAGELINLKHATEDYGKALTKVDLIQREIQSGKYMQASADMKQRLLDQAAAYDKIAASQKKITGELTQQQKMALTYQTTDLFTQIASGQNPMIALIQQGGQLKDAMGGVGGMFRAIGTLLTPFNIALGTTVAIVSALGYSFYKAAADASKLRDDLILTGNFAGTTSAQIVAFSKSLSNELSVGYGKARDVLGELVASGKYSSATFDVMANAILKYSKLAGVDVKEASSKLMSAFDGTASSAKSLNDQYNFLTLAQYKQIEALEKAGKSQEAVAVGAQAFLDSVNKQKRDLGILETAWEKLGDMVNYVKDGLLSIGRNSKQDQLAGIVKEMQYLESVLSGTDTESVANRSANKQRFEKKKQEYLALAKEINEEIARVQEEAAKKAKEKQGVADYAGTGGADKARQLAIQNEQIKYHAAIEAAKETATEEQRIEIEAAQKIADKIYEYRMHSEQEFRANGGQLYKNLMAEQQAILAERDRKLSDERYKQYRKELDLQIAAMQHEEQFQHQRDQAQISYVEKNWLAYKAVEETQKLEQDKLKLQIDMMGSIQKEVDLKKVNLDLEKQIALIKANSAGQTQADVAEAIRLANAEAEQKRNTIELTEVYMKQKNVFDSVYGNMASAIENFVKTGKLNMKDFARSVIQDLIAIRMKAAAMRFLGAAFSMFSGSSVGANGASGMGTGVQGFGSAYADGGNPTPNTINLVGERGPELFIPKTAGTIIPNHALQNMGGVTNVTNNYINAIDTKSFEDRLLGSSNAIWAANQYANKSLAVGRGRA
jgi:phage-related minor tail protein